MLSLTFKKNTYQYVQEKLIAVEFCYYFYKNMNKIVFTIAWYNSDQSNT